jgi:hypothetical protein
MTTFKSERRQAQSRKRRYTPTTSRAFLLTLNEQAAKRDRQAAIKYKPCDPRFCAECAEAEWR